MLLSLSQNLKQTSELSPISRLIKCKTSKIKNEIDETDLKLRSFHSKRSYHLSGKRLHITKDMFDSSANSCYFRI
ncbi:Uncharacterized protein XB16_3585 [Leptospira santarosai]|uniref:Uncharacterized protein n=1 Tax=Leptospira santarosai TaxID=28183 RepID=A0A2P1QY73_9LEPT|nr:Uncharacterized protein XB16_3585 [Leptospira santarosai]